VTVATSLHHRPAIPAAAAVRPPGRPPPGIQLAVVKPPAADAGVRPASLVSSRTLDASGSPGGGREVRRERNALHAVYDLSQAHAYVVGFD